MDQLELERQRSEQYLKIYETFIGKYHQGFADYEKQATESARNALTSATYLNAGGLLAMPAAAALFRPEINVVKAQLIFSGACFVVGLLLVVAAQVCLFFVMSKRGEAMELRIRDEGTKLSNTMYPPGRPVDSTWEAKIEKRRIAGNVLRWIGVGLFFLSVASFIFGCGYGSTALLHAPASVTTQSR